MQKMYQDRPNACSYHQDASAAVVWVTPGDTREGLSACLTCNSHCDDRAYVQDLAMHVCGDEEKGKDG